MSDKYHLRQPGADAVRGRAYTAPVVGPKGGDVRIECRFDVCGG